VVNLLELVPKTEILKQPLLTNSILWASIKIYGKDADYGCPR
jgi:hypothetical protein